MCKIISFCLQGLWAFKQGKVQAPGTGRTLIPSVWIRGRDKCLWTSWVQNGLLSFALSRIVEQFPLHITKCSMSCLNQKYQRSSTGRGALWRQLCPAPGGTDCCSLHQFGSGFRQGLNTLQEFQIISQALSQTIPIIIKLLLLPTSLLRGKPQSLCHGFGMRSLQTTCPFEWREPVNSSTACEKCSCTATIRGRTLWML